MNSADSINTDPPMISVQNLNRCFNTIKALDNISLEVPHGVMLGLLGPSGSGKTTLLRVLAGLDHPDHGTVLFNGEDATNLPPKQRNIGFVFQNYALFRHMNILDNISFGLRVLPWGQRPSRKERHQKAEELLDLVQLNDLGKRYPSQLSGGQRQRVALARALATKPQLLLLDEPFGALDAKVRQDLRRWLRHLHEKVKLTAVFVTHDQDEALEVADQIAIMNQGQIEQMGTPQEIYDRPTTPFVQEFLGQVNSINGHAHGNRVEVLGRKLPCNPPVHGPVTVFLRPHDIDILPMNQDGEEETTTATIIHHAILGPQIQITLAVQNVELEVNLPRSGLHQPSFQTGDKVKVSFHKFRIFPRNK